MGRWGIGCYSAYIDLSSILGYLTKQINLKGKGWVACIDGDSFATDAYTFLGVVKDSDGA